MIGAVPGSERVMAEPGQHLLWLVADVSPFWPCQTRPVEHLAALVSFTGTSQEFASNVRVIQVIPVVDALMERRDLDVKFGDRIRLESVGQVDTVQPYEDSKQGDLIGIQLDWIALGPIESDYTVGVFILDSAGAVVMQLDRYPVAGFRPTSGWQVGERIQDRYGFALPQDIPHGDYTIGVVLYEWPSLERLPVSTRGVTSSDSPLIVGAFTVSDAP
jgi:hypothetical protein